MSKEILSKFGVFCHSLQNIHMTRDTCLTLLGGLVQTLDNVTNNKTPCQKLDSYYNLVEHIMGSNYILSQQAISVYNDIVLKFEKSN